MSTYLAQSLPNMYLNMRSVTNVLTPIRAKPSWKRNSYVCYLSRGMNI